MSTSDTSSPDSPASAPGPTVFIVDDDGDFSDALKFLIESDGLVAETYSSAQTFLDAYDPARPGCVLLDLRMPGMSGLDAYEHLRSRNAMIPVIIITAYGTMPTAVRAMKVGALDVLEKPVGDEILLKRIHQAIALDAEKRPRAAKQRELRELIEKLTPRERQVMESIVAGKANKHIAFEFGLSEKTVEVHRKHVMKKLNVRTVVDLVRTVLMSGIHDEPE